MSYTYSKIATVTVGSGGVSSINFLAIPQNYTDLCLQISLRGTNSNIWAATYFQFNGDTSANYAKKYLEGSGAAVSAGSASSGTAFDAGNSAGASATASTFGSGIIYIPNYTSSNYKSIYSDITGENNASTSYMDLMSGLWNSSSPINSIAITNGTGSGNLFAQYSTATLYGIKAEV